MTTGDADVTALVVTYNSADSVLQLIDSLRMEAAHTTLRVVVIDNASGDSTVDDVAAQSDVVIVDAGGNMGYAAAINRGMEFVEDSAAVLVLNPDATVTPGCVATLVAALAEPGVVAVVPTLTEHDGSLSYSLRREPTLLAAAVDVALGSYLPRRPAATSETVRSSDAYRTTHDIEWATGAAVMIDANAARRAGAWDERFFLYSEETDYFRRLREQGRIRFVPDAVIVHTGAGSGSSQELQNLLTVNKIRYAEKYHGLLWTATFRGLVAASELARCSSVAHRRTLRVVLDRRRWSALPAARRRPATPRTGMGTVVIPAHNESAVIARTLEPLAELAERGIVEVIVACNGCTDDTADIARRIAGITVLETSAASKTGAMNAADDVAMFWPRVYLDADIIITPTTILDVLAALENDGYLSGRPHFVYDTSHSSPLVRRYYAARSRIPEFSRHLWGAGCYAMSEEGHRRLGPFPDVIADDVVVDSVFEQHEKAFVATTPVIVSVPRTVRALVDVLSRNYGGVALVERTTRSTGSLRGVASGISGPGSAVNAVVYVGFALAGRRAAARRHDSTWQRDETTRV